MIPAYLSLDIPDSDKPRLVIVGGGFAGLELARNLKKGPYQIVLLDRNNYHTFQPLLYQVATSGLEPDSIAGPLRKVFDGFRDFYFRMVRVERVDFQKQIISTPIGALSYDFLVLACGSKTNFFGLEEVKRKAFPLKKIVHALNLRSHILQNFEKAVLTTDRLNHQRLMNLVVVGGGPTGVEVAGALGELKHHVLPSDFPDLDFSDMKVFLVEAGSRVLADMSVKAGTNAKKYLEQYGTEVILNAAVTGYNGETVFMNNGESIESHTLIWAAGVQGDLVEGLPDLVVDKSRILVNDYNQIENIPNIFAIGDIALMKNHDAPNGHPMVAQVAIQQGRLLAKNLRAIFYKNAMQPFKYKDLGSMATVGRKKAVVDFPQGLKFGGFSAWLLWMFIHLISLIGFRNKLVTFVNWVWSYITYDKGNRLIIRTFDKEKTSPVEAG